MGSVSRQLTSSAKVECSDDRLLELNRHTGPLTEAGHHTQGEKSQAALAAIGEGR